MTDNNISVYVYIDGFNVFHAIKKFGKKYYWLDYKKLAEKYLSPGEKIKKVFYFTAYFNADSQGVIKHKNYINALKVREIKPILGKYQEVERNFSNKNSLKGLGINRNITNSRIKNGFVLTKKIFLSAIKYLIYFSWEEKRTDVNMAIQILADGMQKKYQKAIIITADSDISPAIYRLKKNGDNNLTFVSIVPIGHDGKVMKNVCDAQQVMKESDLKDSLLNECVKGFRRPADWQ